MTFWIVTHRHRHGLDAWPEFGADKPTEAEVAKSLGELYEPDKDEYLEIFGPFTSPGEISTSTNPQPQPDPALVEAIESGELDPDIT